MNTNLSRSNGIRELSADDLGSVSGGSDVRAAVVGYVVTKLIEEVRFVDGLMKNATGTLKGLTPRPPK